MFKLVSSIYHRAGGFVHHRHHNPVAAMAPLPRGQDIPNATDDALASWLRNATHEALNRAVRSTDWQAVTQRKHGKRRIYRALTEKRVDDLTLDNRAHLAAVLIGLQAKHAGGTVCALLMSTRGGQLAQLKQAIDQGTGDSLTDFVWQQRPGRRAAMLEHIKKHAVRQPQVYLFSDIDNTWTPSRDKQYAASHACYPGAQALYTAIVGGEAHFDHNVIFLSARPGTPEMGFRRLSKHVRNVTYTMLHGMGNTCHVVFGDFWHCIPRPWFHPLALLGVKKAESFRRWVAVHPEYRYVFFGDSGESDIQAGVTMMRQNPENIADVFIHDLGNVVPNRRASYEKMGVAFYKSAAGAALEAWQHNLIDVPELLAVNETTRTDFAKLHFSSAVMRAARLHELNHELAMAERSLHHARVA